MLEDEADIRVVGEASDGEEAIKLARSLKPQVIVMDCALPGMNGLQATRKILQLLPETLVLMFSMHTEETWVRQAIDAGARGYVLKNAMDLELSSAIRRLVKGETVLDGQLSKQQALQRRTQCRPHAAGSRNTAAHLRWQVEQGDCKPARTEREHRRRASRQYHGRAGNP